MEQRGIPHQQFLAKEIAEEMLLLVAVAAVVVQMQTEV
jgi:hypothetical protein